MNKESIIAYISELNPEYTINAAQYLLPPVFEWQAILAGDMHKNIRIESLQYLINDKRIELNAFVL